MTYFKTLQAIKDLICGVIANLEVQALITPPVLGMPEGKGRGSVRIYE